MSELKNTTDNMVNRLKENIKNIVGQAERIEYWLREFETLAGKIEKIEEENIQLKRDLEVQKKDYEKKITELARTNK